MKNNSLSYLACGCLIIAAFLGGLYLGRSIGSTPVYTVQTPSGTTLSTAASQMTDAASLPSTTEATATDPTSEPTQAPTQSGYDIAVSGGSVNINTADLETLQTLPKIGPKIAQAIIDYRNENGPFQNIGQITDVPGIGSGIFKLIKDYITVGG